MRHKEDLSEYVSELNVQETTYGEHLDFAQQKIEFLQRKLAESQEILPSEQDQVKTLDRSYDSSQALLKSQRKKVKHFILADSRNQYRLQTEQNKVNVLEQSISDLKSSIEKLSKKAMILDGAQDQMRQPIA
jgi:chromosome segregation ATPase